MPATVASSGLIGTARDASGHAAHPARHSKRRGACTVPPPLLPSLLALAAIASTSTWGCLLTGQSRSDTLQDAVHAMVDELRWARPELAADRVAVAYRARFLRSRQGWGERIQIADCDMQTIRMAPDERSATVVMAVSWYGLDDMDLRQTRIRQRWELVGGAFLLASERVVGGDPSLLGAMSPVQAPPAGAAESVAWSDEAGHARRLSGDVPGRVAER